MVALGSGVACALGNMAALNEFRYGSLLNSVYFQEFNRTPGVLRKLDYFFGLWLSPSSGIVAFWPVATILLTISTVVFARRFYLRSDSEISWIPLCLTLVAGFGFIAVLSAWYAPFGWVTYGPRLAAPILPAFVVLACSKAEPEISAMAAWTARFRSIPVILAVLAGIAVLPQVSAPWSYEASMTSLMAADNTCPIMSESSLSDPVRYYSCSHQYMWRVQPSALFNAMQWSSSVGAFGQILGAVSASLLVCAALARRSRVTTLQFPEHLAHRATSYKRFSLRWIQGVERVKTTESDSRNEIASDSQRTRRSAYQPPNTFNLE